MLRHMAGQVYGRSAGACEPSTRACGRRGHGLPQRPALPHVLQRVAPGGRFIQAIDDYERIAGQASTVIEQDLYTLRRNELPN